MREEFHAEERGDGIFLSRTSRTKIFNQTLDKYPQYVYNQIRGFVSALRKLRLI